MYPAKWVNHSESNTTQDEEDEYQSKIPLRSFVPLDFAHTETMKTLIVFLTLPAICIGKTIHVYLRLGKPNLNDF